MATAHGQLIADLDWKPFRASLLSLDKATQQTTTSAASRFLNVDKVMKDAAKTADQLAQKMVIAEQRAARTGARANLAMQDRLMDLHGSTTPGARGRSSGDTRSYRAGQAALQAQDIAIQLEQGTNPGRVLIQQGTQLASIFGPKGAIIGGAVALVAVIGAQILGVTKLVEQEEKLGKAAQKRLALNRELAGNAIKASEEATQLERERMFGKDKAEAMGREDEYRRRLTAIRNQAGGEGSAFEEEETRRFKAREALIEKEKRLEAQAIKENALKEREEAQRALFMQTATNKQRSQRLATEMQQMKEVRAVEVDPLKQIQQETQMAQKQMELNEQMRRNDQDRADKAKEIQKAFEAVVSLGKELDGVFKSAMDGMKTKVGEVLAAQLSQKQRSDMDAGSRILSKAQDIMDPQAAKERDRELRRQDRAINRAARREVDEADASDRRAGGRGFTEKEREDMRLQKIDLARKAREGDKNMSRIDPADITQLATKIAEENAKLITK